MPSEKFRYLDRNRGPVSPLDQAELKEHLSILGVERLSNLLWIRAQEDDVLIKTLMASVAIQLAKGDWWKVKSAIDYALHFPDYVRYNDGGHGQILEEIKIVLGLLVSQGQREFAIRAAQYAIERGHDVAENFEDDWDWTSSLKDLEEWVREIKSGM